ncbi:MAG: PKD domain-containing protein [Smithellaceae bacterium]|nr:PKD domain-containing protein [Smithellaceae bacterium]
MKISIRTAVVFLCLAALVLAGCTTSESDGTSGPIVKEHSAPVASPGLDKATYVDDVIALDGTKSADPDGEITSYNWEITGRPEGSNATLEDAATATPTLAPDREGIYKVKLTVTDEKGLSDSRECAVTAVHPGLPIIPSGALPGPAVLYMPPVKSPILSNHRDCFKAEPLLISGTEAYIDGEYLYQDYIYDDYGSGTIHPAELNLIRIGSASTGSLVPRMGCSNYPTNLDRYGNNAADLVEFRIALEEDKVVYRITLNALLEKDSTCIVIACDSDLNILTGNPILPWDPGAIFPGTDEAIFIWGTGAEHVRRNGMDWVHTELTEIDTDLEANQITVAVPRAISNPTDKWRLTVATGLYDTANHSWLRPGYQATESQPGGAGPFDLAPCGIFNLAFRFDEPINSRNTPPDERQSEVLRNKVPTVYAHEIDFGRLERRETDISGIPKTGWQVRIFPTRNNLGEKQVMNLSFNLVLASEPFEEPEYFGPLQTYSLYIPSTYDPAKPTGFTLALHSLGQFHRQYNGTSFVQQIGESRNNIVASPNGLGSKGLYIGPAELDTFEVWSDVAHHFNLDPRHTAITGYSMGGYGTYRLATLYPDLFGQAMSIVGTPTGNLNWDPPTTCDKDKTLVTMWLENARNVPFMNLNSMFDETVKYSGARAVNQGMPEAGINGFEQYGYRYRFLTFETPHIGLYLLDNYPMAAGFLGDALVDRDPHHVTLAYVPISDDTSLGLIHNHAYWLSGLELADPSREGDFSKGVVDAFSYGFAKGDPVSSPFSGGGLFPLPYAEVGRSWGEAPVIAKENRLDLTITNLKAVRVETVRAMLAPDKRMTVRIISDSVGQLLLAGDFAPNVTVTSGGRYTPDGVVIDYGKGDTLYEIMPPELPLQGK